MTDISFLKRKKEQQGIFQLYKSVDIEDFLKTYLSVMISKKINIAALNIIIFDIDIVFFLKSFDIDSAFFLYEISSPYPRKKYEQRRQRIAGKHFNA